MSDIQTICTVKSFDEENKNATYVITRKGVRIDEGGTGVQWACSCPAHAFGRGRLCKHAMVLFALVKGGESWKYPHVSLGTHYRMSENGMKLFATSEAVQKAYAEPKRKQSLRNAKGAKAVLKALGLPLLKAVLTYLRDGPRKGVFAFCLTGVLHFPCSEGQSVLHL